MEVIRYSKNPILTKESVPFRVNSIFNPGAVKYKDEYILLSRVEMPNGKSALVIARSKDGYSFSVDSKPVLSIEDHTECSEYVQWGIEDARINKVDNKFYLTYTGYSKHKPLVILAETEDFETFKIHGPISEPSNKDCAIFPEKINGFYWKIDRPEAGERRDIWISKSPDLIHWGDPSNLMEAEKGTWEEGKIGGSTPPIKTKDGWLMLYHGVKGVGFSNLYRVGVVLLDLENPRRVKGRSKIPILSPEKDYERIGDVGNVIFTNGWVVEDDGKVIIYYSGADMNICIATTTVKDLLSACDEVDDV